MGRFSGIANDNPFAQASKTVKSSKDFDVQPEILKEPAKNIVTEPKKKQETTPKTATRKQTKKTLPKEEIHKDAEVVEYDNLKRNPIIDLNDSQYKRVRRVYNRGTKRQGRYTCSIYLTESENALIKDIADSYDMSVSELVRTLLINLKKADE